MFFLKKFPGENSCLAYLIPLLISKYFEVSQKHNFLGMRSNLKTVKGLETKKSENCCVTYEGKCSGQHMIERFLPAVYTTLTEKVLVILSRFTSS